MNLNYKFEYINSTGLIIYKTKNSLSRGKNYDNKFKNSLKFLNKANQNDYFSYKELNKRFKEIYITYAKDLMISLHFSKKLLFVFRKILFI